MGFLDKLAKAITEAQKQSKASSGKFTFQEEGKNPKRDSDNRVIVKVSTGNKIVLGVNKEDISDKAIALLLGKPEADKEVENKSVRLRITRDLESPYPDSVKIETVKGDFVGWVLKRDSALGARIIDSLTSQVQSLAPDIGAIVFDVGAKVDGTFDEDEDEQGKISLEPDLQHVEIQIKDPAEIDILSEG